MQLQEEREERRMCEGPVYLGKEQNKGCYIFVAQLFGLAELGKGTKGVHPELKTLLQECLKNQKLYLLKEPVTIRYLCTLVLNLSTGDHIGLPISKS